MSKRLKSLNKNDKKVFKEIMKKAKDNQIHKDDMLQFVFQESYIKGFYLGDSVCSRWHRDLEQGEA